MKKVLTILVLLTYFAVSTGFVVNLHYCMDRFHSWELGHSEKDLCDTCGMESGKSKCCHDEFKVVKLQNDQAPAQYAVFAFSVPAEVPSFTSLYLIPDTRPVALPAAPAKGPPPLLKGQDTHVFHCVFRI